LTNGTAEKFVEDKLNDQLKYNGDLWFILFKPSDRLAIITSTADKYQTWWQPSCKYGHGQNINLQRRQRRCRNIEHIIYFGESDMYDNRGQSDDYSIFSLDSLDGHWRYVIQQVNSGRWHSG